MNTEIQIEFNKIQNMWSELAATDYAKNLIKKAGVILDEKELRKQLRDTTEGLSFEISLSPSLSTCSILPISCVASTLRLIST